MADSQRRKVATQLHAALMDAFAPEQLEVVDESHHHAGHAEAGDGEETHLRIIIASDTLKGKSRVLQHKAIYACAAPWMNNPIHALAIDIR